MCHLYPICTLTLTEQKLIITDHIVTFTRIAASLPLQIIGTASRKVKYSTEELGDHKDITRKLEDWVQERKGPPPTYRGFGAILLIARPVSQGP